MRIVATQKGRRKENNFNNPLSTVCFDTGRYVTCVDPPPRSRTPTVEDELLTYSATNTASFFKPYLQKIHENFLLIHRRDAARMKRNYQTGTNGTHHLEN